MSPGLIWIGGIWGTAVAWIKICASVRQCTHDGYIFLDNTLMRSHCGIAMCSLRLKTYRLPATSWPLHCNRLFWAPLGLTASHSLLAPGADSAQPANDLYKMNTPTFHRSPCSSVSSLHKPEFQAWLEELMRRLDVASVGIERQALELHDYGDVARPSEKPSMIVDGGVQSIRGSVKAFWREQIVVHIGHEDTRDHYGKICPHSSSALMVEASFLTALPQRSAKCSWVINGRYIWISCANQTITALERTFFAYIRTSLAFAMLGIYIAQLFRLQHTLDSGSGFGFFTLGIPLACLCTGAAIVIAVLGAYRFWRQQSAMLRGKIHVWGWDMAAIAFAAFSVSTGVMCLHPAHPAN